MASDGSVSRSLMALALAVTVCLPTASMSAQSAAAKAGAGPPVLRPRAVQGSGAIRPRATAVQGSAWRADNSPIPRAIVRLRNVTSGGIQASAIADDTGTFAFSGIPDGTYLVELVSDGGKVLSVGHVFTVAPGETVATFVRLGADVPWFNGFFGNAALAVAAGAAAAGIAALSPGIVTSVSPNR